MNKERVRRVKKWRREELYIEDDENKEIEEERRNERRVKRDATNGTILFYESINLWFIINGSIINIIINNFFTNDLKIIRIKIIYF